MSSVSALASSLSNLSIAKGHDEITLHEAIEKNRPIHEISQLIDIRTINQKSNGKTALWYAVAAGNIAVVILLLKKGADAFIADDEKGNSCFHLAALNQNSDILSELKAAPILHGQLDTKNKDGFTAFYIAAELGNAAIANDLMELGASLDVRCGDNKQTALHVAALNSHPAIISCFRRAPTSLINAKTKDGGTAFYFACQSASVELATALLELKANPGIKSGDVEWLGIHVAAHKGYVHIIEIFKKYPGLLNVKTESGNTALYLACQSGHKEAVKILLDMGADAEVLCGPQKDTAYHVASINGHIDVLEVFAKVRMISCVTKKRTSILALEEAIQGKNIDAYIQYIDSALIGNEARKFSNFALIDMQATLLLLLWRFIKEEKPGDLHLFLRCLTFYISRLDAEERVAGFSSYNLDHAIKSGKHNALSALEDVANDLIEGKEREFDSSSNEQNEFSCILSAIAKNSHFDIDLRASTLVEWVRASRPEQSRMLSMFELFAEGVINEEYIQNKLALLKRFCQLEKNTYLKACLTVQVVGVTKLLERALEGQDVEECIEYIAAILFNEESSTIFSCFTSHERRACILLLLHTWEKTTKHKYLDLILYALPYCVDELKEYTFQSELASTIRMFLIKSEAPQGIGLVQYLLRLPINFDKKLLVDALSMWYTYEKPIPQDTAIIISLYAELATEGKNIRGAAYDILLELALRSKKIKSLPAVLFALRGIGRFDKENFEWVGQLDKHELELLIDILNCPAFPKNRRSKYFNYLVTNNIQCASCLVASLKLPEILELLSAIKNCSDKALRSASLLSFMQHVADSTIKIEALNALARSSTLMSELIMDLIENPSQPALYFYGVAARSGHAEIFRTAILSSLLLQEAPAHFWFIALYILQPSDTLEIKQLITNIQTNRDLLNTFVNLVVSQNIEPTLKDAIIRELLAQQTPTALMLATQISGNLLPLSALTCLAQKAAKQSRILQKTAPYKRNEQDESEFAQISADLQQAVLWLANSTWYNDPTRLNNDPEWFKEHKIGHFPGNDRAKFFRGNLRASFRPTWYRHCDVQLYTKYDDTFSDLTELFSGLALSCQLDSTVTKDAICEKLTNVIILDAKCTRARHSYAQSRYKRTLVNQHLKTKN